jgi:hypothetical protein
VKEEVACEPELAAGPHSFYATVMTIPAGAVNVVTPVSTKKVIVCPAVMLTNVVTVRDPMVE